MPGKLNSFQRTMLHWNDLHPYNAVSVLEVATVFDPVRLRQVINRALEFQGLAGLKLGSNRRTFTYQGGPVDCEVKVLSGGENPDAVLAAEMESQLNTGFPIGDCFNPFRFFALPQADSFALGIAFLHVVADGEAIFHLHRDIVEACLAPGEPRFARPLELYPPCGDGLLARPGLLASKIAAWWLWLRNGRNSARIFCYNPADYANRVTLFRLDTRQVDALVKTAKAWQLTINDLVLALLLMCFSRQLSDRMKHPRRRKISVGCIVNVRKVLGLANQRAFVPMVGSFMVTHDLPEGVRLRELSADVGRQTLAVKRGRLYFGADFQMALGRFFFSRYSGARQKRLYHKNFPLWGGVTNIDLRAFRRSAGRISFDALGAVSTGPLVPLVFCLANLGDRANVTITYRPAFYPDENIAQLKADFLSLVEQLHLERNPSAGERTLTA